MSTVDFISKVSYLTNSVNDLELKEKYVGVDMDFSYQHFDRISTLKTFLTTSSSQLTTIIDKLSELTWFDDELTQDVLKDINLLLALCDRLKRSLKRNISLIALATNNTAIAKDELKMLRNSTRDFEDTIGDLEFVFFFAPKSEEMQDLNNELSML
jgi:hypothetical protein